MPFGPHVGIAPSIFPEPCEELLAEASFSETRARKAWARKSFPLAAAECGVRVGRTVPCYGTPTANFKIKQNKAKQTEQPSRREQQRRVHCAGLIEGAPSPRRGRTDGQADVLPSPDLESRPGAAAGP